MSVPSSSENGAITWGDCYPAGTGESGYIAVHPEDPNVVYVGAVGSSPGGGGALVPSGTGLLVLGGDDVEIEGNTFSGNHTVGVAVFSTATAFAADRLDVGPNPERVHVHNNVYLDNGAQPDKMLTDLGISGADIIWDASHWDNRFDERGVSTFPPGLPSSGWPDVLRRAYWQVVHFVISKL